MLAGVQAWALTAIAIFLIVDTRFEAEATLTVSGAAARGPDWQAAAAKHLLRLALQHVSEPPSELDDPHREFRVDALSNAKLRLLCQAESAEVADELCVRATNDAQSHAPGFALEAKQNALPRLRPRLIASLLPALAVGLLWFVLRLVLLRRREAQEAPGEPAPDAQRWAMPGRPATSVPGLDLPLPDVGAWPQRAGGSAAVSGTPSIVHRDVEPGPDTDTEQDTSATRWQSSRAPEPSGRVLYLVSPGPWRGDEQVLTAEPVEQLRALCTELRSLAANGCIAVRVASGLASRYAKSQVAAQLAWLLVEQAKLRVLLVEGDLDAPALDKVLRVQVPRGFGFSEQLEQLRSAGSTGRGVTRMRLADHLLGLLESRSGHAALLDSPQFSAVIASERGEHDVIVIDGPVVEDWPDAQALTGVPQAVVCVVAAGTPHEESLPRLQAHFASVETVRVIRTGT